MRKIVLFRKNKIAFFTLIVGLLFPSAYAFAHMDNDFRYDPYGMPAPYSASKYEYEYEYESCTQSIVSLSYTQPQIEKLKSICRNRADIKMRAQVMRDKKICDGLVLAIRAGRELIGLPDKGKGDFTEDTIQGQVQDCYNKVGQVSFLPPSPLIKKIDAALFFVTSGLALVYLFAVLWLKGIGEWKFLILPVIFQALISTIFGFVLAVRDFLIEGPVIAPLHDILFFRQDYLSLIFITGLVVTILCYLLMRLLLLILKNDLDRRQRRMIACFYTLVFNPFFFPIGALAALMHIIYASSPSKQSPDSISTTSAPRI